VEKECWAWNGIGNNNWIIWGILEPRLANDGTPLSTNAMVSTLFLRFKLPKYLYFAVPVELTVDDMSLMRDVWFIYTYGYSSTPTFFILLR
jgi:hypothetical protein